MSFKRRSLTLALKALATVAHSVGWRGCAHGIKNRERFFRPFCITSAFSPGAAGAGAACVVAQDDATPSTATSPMRRFAVGDATCALRAERDRGSYGRGSNHPNHVQQPTGHGRADRPSTGTHQTRRRTQPVSLVPFWIPQLRDDQQPELTSLRPEHRRRTKREPFSGGS